MGPAQCAPEATIWPADAYRSRRAMWTVKWVARPGILEVKDCALHNPDVVLWACRMRLVAMQEKPCRGDRRIHRERRRWRHSP